MLRGMTTDAILQEYPERESNSAQSEKSGRAESQTVFFETKAACKS
jgi:hypothetical protein